MGAVIAVDLSELPDLLDLGERRMRRAIAAGALAGAHRGRAVMVKRTPVDQGQLKAGWRVKAGDKEFTGPDSTLAELINDAPHISMVELGARPHTVNPEGWAAIYEWVRRHFRGGQLGGKGRMRPRGMFAGLQPFKGEDPVITQITNAIVFKIRKYGMRATLFVRNSVDELRAVMATELERAMTKIEADLGRGGGGA